MAVSAIKEYVGVARDSLEKFNGKQLVYFSWDHHLLFAAPFLLCVEPQMTVQQLIDGALVPLLQADPDAAGLDWSQVEWLKSNQPWRPELQRSLADNGIGHKDQIRLRTAGLNSLQSAA